MTFRSIFEILRQNQILVDYDPQLTLHELEKKYILKALSHFGGNKTQAANNLGITIKTLYNKLHEYGEFDKFAVHTPVR
jgi:DNA-binding NtrC family response regulator